MSMQETARYWELLRETPGGWRWAVAEYLVAERAALHAGDFGWENNPFSGSTVYEWGTPWWEVQVSNRDLADFVIKARGCGGWPPSVEKALAKTVFREVCSDLGHTVEEVVAKPAPRALGDVRRRAMACAWFCTRATLEDVCEISRRTKAQVVKEIEEVWNENKDFDLGEYACEILDWMAQARSRAAAAVRDASGEWPEQMGPRLWYSREWKSPDVGLAEYRAIMGVFLQEGCYEDD